MVVFHDSFSYIVSKDDKSVVHQPHLPMASFESSSVSFAAVLCQQASQTCVEGPMIYSFFSTFITTLP